MWNDLNLTRPVSDICDYGKRTCVTVQKFTDLVTVLTSSAEILAENHPIWEEIQIFKNLQTKYKRILHCDKCLQYLQRVSTCLRKMVLCDISKTYLDLVDQIVYGLQSDSTCFLPSRQQLEYVLIRTQSAAKLICESLHYSRETFCYLIQRLKVGHLIINLMIATSVTARLNIVFKGLLIQMCDIYNKLYLFREGMKKGGYEWPKPLELPEDLDSWIDLEGSEYVKPRHLPQEELDFLTNIFDKNSYTRTKERALFNSSKQPNTEDYITSGNDNEDNGVLVERSEVDLIEPELEVINLEDADIARSHQIENSEVEMTEPELQVTDLEMESADSDLEITDSVNASEDQEPVQIFPDKRRVVEKMPNLSKAQKLLLKKIKNAKDVKELKIIWENLDFSTPDLLPEAVTPEKIRFIDKMFLRVKRRISQTKKSSMSEDEKKNEMDFIIQMSRLKFAKSLGILSTKKKGSKSKVMKPVKTFGKLKEMYETIYHKLQTAQKYKKCAKLKKIFKSRKADMKFLVESGEKETAKKLVFNTSKLLITDYL